MKMNRYCWELQDLIYPLALHQMWGHQMIIALDVMMLVLVDRLHLDPVSSYQKQAQATNPRTFREHVKGLDTHKQRRLRNLVTMTNMMEARLCRHLLLSLP